MYCLYVIMLSTLLDRLFVIFYYVRAGVATFLSSPVPTNDALNVALSSLGALASSEVNITLPLYVPVVDGNQPPFATSAALFAEFFSNANTASIGVCAVIMSKRFSNVTPSPSLLKRFSVLTSHDILPALLVTHLPPLSFEVVSVVSMLIVSECEVAKAIDLPLINSIKSRPLITFAISYIILFFCFYCVCE
nr:MAG TPA: hypothetical protein [Caudoviricetes sp.]